jgi:PLP dependent protein
VAVSPDTAIAARVAEVRARIASACSRSGRDERDVRLVAATKTVAVPAMEAAYEAGVSDFGENRAVDLARKAERANVPDATWHYLGRLQSGTIKHVARHADVVQSAEPGSALEALARRLDTTGRSIPILLEVDFTRRRMGVAAEDVLEAAEAVSKLRGVTLRGLMTVAPLTADPQEARPVFRALRTLRDRLVEREPGATELSMGMSFDYTIAIEEGATMVRVGTAIFGERPDPRA